MWCNPLNKFDASEYGCHLYKKFEGSIKGVTKAIEEVPVVTNVNLKNIGNADVISTPYGSLEVWFDAPKSIVVKDGTLSIKSL